MKTQLALLEEENDAKEERVAQLEALGHTRDDAQYRRSLRLVSARVIGYDPLAWYHVIIVDKGEREGVSRGMAVARGADFVGRVIDTGKSWSRVRLLTDPQTAVGGLLVKQRSRGLVTGQGSGNLRMEYIDKEAAITEGDIVITSGAAGDLEETRGFPQGLVIGMVLRVSEEEGGWYKNALLRSAIDFRRLENVVIVAVDGTGETPEE